MQQILTWRIVPCDSAVVPTIAALVLAKTDNPKLIIPNFALGCLDNACTLFSIYMAMNINTTNDEEKAYQSATMSKGFSDVNSSGTGTGSSAHMLSQGRNSQRSQSSVQETRSITQVCAVCQCT